MFVRIKKGVIEWKEVFMEKELYEKIAQQSLTGEDLARAEYYYASLASFYPQVMQDSKLMKLFEENEFRIEDSSLEKMLSSQNATIGSEVMPNKEIRCRVVDGQTKFSYVVVDARSKDMGGFPHQNSYEHYYTIEVCRVESGYAIAAELLRNKTVKLVRYNPGEYWASIPGFVHNTSLQDGSHTTTLKTSSPLQDWYGTGNVINSQLSYYVDSRTKTLDLDQMNYVIKHYDGIVDNQVVEEFNLDQKWNDIREGQIVSPYEVLITPENREQFRALLLQTKNNDLAAFYANLTRQDIDLATGMAYIFRNNVQQALEEAISKNDVCDVEKAKEFVKIKNL